MTGVLIRREKKSTKRNMRTMVEAEVGVMCLQVNTQRGLLETRRKARKDASLKKAWTTDILISTSSLPELRENKRLIFLSHWVCSALLWQPKKTNTASL